MTDTKQPDSVDANADGKPDTIDDKFNNLIHNVLELSKTARELVVDAKNLKKTFIMVRKETKKNKKKDKQPQKKMKPSPNLVKFLKLSKDTNYTRADIMKGISAYVKTHNLQIEDDKRKFLPNGPLMKLFGLTKETVTKMTFIEINKYISQHLTTLAES